MTPPRRFVALGLAAVAFALAFVYPAITPARVAWYDPVGHAWSYEVRPPGVAIDFFGRCAQATVAWAVVLAVALVVVRRLPALGARAVGLVAAWVLTAIVFVMLFYAWTLHYRVPVPAPLPEGAGASAGDRGR